MFGKTRLGKSNVVKLIAQGILESTKSDNSIGCLLYTSDAADERSSVDLGGRRIIKKKNYTQIQDACKHKSKND